MKRYDYNETETGQHEEHDDGEWVRFSDADLQLVMRKAKAFRAIAERNVFVFYNADNNAWKAKRRIGFLPGDPDQLLTAIESAMTATTTGRE